jgi:hypothetical protein
VGTAGAANALTANALSAAAAAKTLKIGIVISSSSPPTRLSHFEQIKNVDIRANIPTTQVGSLSQHAGITL